VFQNFAFNVHAPPATRPDGAVTTGFILNLRYAEELLPTVLACDSILGAIEHNPAEILAQAEKEDFDVHLNTSDSDFEPQVFQLVMQPGVLVEDAWSEVRDTLRVAVAELELTHDEDLEILSERAMALRGSLPSSPVSAAMLEQRARQELVAPTTDRRRRSKKKKDRFAATTEV
jgi:hypothetical protein